MSVSFSFVQVKPGFITLNEVRSGKISICQFT